MRAVARAPVALVARERRATIRTNRARRDARAGATNATNESENATSAPITRRGVVNAASLALAAPLAMDAAHDLGFVTGDEDLPADLTRGRRERGRGRVRGRVLLVHDGAVSRRSTACARRRAGTSAATWRVLDIATWARERPDTSKA